MIRHKNIWQLMLYWDKEDSRTEGRNPYRIGIAREILLRYFPGDFSGTIRSSQKKKKIKNQVLGTDRKWAVRTNWANIVLPIWSVPADCVQILTPSLRTTLLEKVWKRLFRVARELLPYEGCIKWKFSAFSLNMVKIWSWVDWRVSRECVLMSDIKLFY